MSRFDELKDILNRGKYFKVVCGAGNEDAQEVYKLSLVYALAGALGIDVSANIDIVKSAADGIKKAFDVAPKLSRQIKIRPFINVSIGMRGDPHIRKATIYPDICTSCGICVDRCLQKAVSDGYKVVTELCIGCGECADVCPAGAVKFFDKAKELEKILPECLKCGAEIFELHAVIQDDESVMGDWRLINDILRDNFVSMCVDRSQMSDAHLIRRIKLAHQITGERLMIQADGIPMSGGKDDFNTTLQAIAIADIIKKHNSPGMLLISGGTNSNSGELARMCGVKINGVAIGTFARKIVSNYIEDKRFGQDMDLVAQAVSAAEKLILDNIGPVYG